MKWRGEEDSWSARRTGLLLAAGVLGALGLAAQEEGKPRDLPGGASPPPPAAPAAADLSEADRLAAALRLKEERRLEEAVFQLESLARSSRMPQGVLDRASRELPVDHEERGGRRAAVPTAAGVLAELEAIDARLRRGQREGLPERLRRLTRDWGTNADVRRRARALGSLTYLRDGALLEPNAISRVDLGKRFKERFFAGRGAGSEPEVPLDLAIRHLSRLSSGPAAGRSGPRSATAAVTLAGFLGIADLSSDRTRPWRRVLDSFDVDPRVLIALFVFTGDAELPASPAGEEPWSRAAIFWIRGTPASLSSAVVRSRYEWLPGPTFFLLEPGGKIRSWRWPHEGWEGFLDHDLPGVLSGHPAAVEEGRSKEE